MTDLASQVREALEWRALIDAELAQRASEKFPRYFHDCLPGCHPTSLAHKDHVSLRPGEQGPTCRKLYIKSLQLMAAGVRYPERGYIAANRIGKTDTAAYEIRCHLTGRYPPWWKGRRWERPTDWRAAGDTMLTTRDVPQKALLGHPDGVPVKKWTGMIESRFIVNVTRKSGGVNNCVDTIYVEHAEKVHGAPGISMLSFLSYDMGRRVFQGFECDGMWLDEEVPDPAETAEEQAAGSTDIYGECLLRTMTTDGIIIATFTPLRGLTTFLKNYLATALMPGTDEDVPAKDHFAGQGAAAVVDESDPEAIVDESTYAVASDTEQVNAEANPFGTVDTRFVVGATWDDAPHLTEKMKAQQWAGMLPYQRDARAKGIPQLGAGVIYPIGEAEITVPDFSPIPAHWWRGFGMDVGGGAKPTAAVFGAFNPDDRTLYITSVYKRTTPEPSLHAAAIKERMYRPTGWYWPGVGDAAALIMTEHDVQQLVQVYKNLGLDLNLADKSVETGIADLWDLMVTGRFKVFKSCVAWFSEFRLYRRGKNGRIVKSNDHLMDSTRYLARSGIARMRAKPAPEEPITTIEIDRSAGGMGLGWLGG